MLSKIKTYYFFASILMFFLTSCVDDRTKIKKESTGEYVSKETIGELFSNQSSNKIRLTIYENGKYRFQPKIDYISEVGTWTLFKEGLVRYIVLKNEDGSEDRISTCCSETGEVIFYYYLNKEDSPERIIFDKL